MRFLPHVIGIIVGILLLVIVQRQVRRSGDEKMAKSIKFGIIGTAIWYGIKLFIAIVQEYW